MLTSLPSPRAGLVPPTVRSQLSSWIRFLAALVTCHLPALRSAALALCVVGSLGTSPAALAAAIKFNIPAQAAADALLAFSKQSGSDVLFPSIDLKKVRANEVVGEFEPAAALTKLLDGTGYTAAPDGARFVVRAASVAPGSVSGTLVPSRGGKSLDSVTVTVLETGERTVVGKRGDFKFHTLPPGTYTLGASGEGFSRLKITDVVVRAGIDTILGIQEMPGSRGDNEVQTMQEVVVSAKKDIETLATFEVSADKLRPFANANVDLPRTVDDVKAYYIFEASAIETSGATSLDEFLAQWLPMNTSSEIFSNLDRESVSSYVRGGSNVNLRGLGTSQTLILINGRRQPSVAGSSYAASNQSDLNGIPMSAIERIEVLPSSASGIYGGGAVGGVVNVILKRNYSGSDVKLTYDNVFGSDAARRKVDFTSGFTLENGKTRVLMSGSFGDGHSLAVQDRIGPIRESIWRRYGNNPLAENPPRGATPNIYGNGVNLTLKNGTPLNASYTYIPAGYRGVALDGTAPLVANARSYNNEPPDTTQNRFGLRHPLGGTPETNAILASVRRRMTDRLEVFADFSYNSSLASDNIGIQVSSLSVPATASINPFQQAVVVSVPEANTVDVYSRNLTRNLSGGFNLKLPRNWQIQGDYSWGDGRNSYTSGFTDSTAINAAILSGAVNPFQDTLRAGLNLSGYRTSGYSQSRSTVRDASLRTAGPLLALPGGDLSIAASVGRVQTTVGDVFTLGTILADRTRDTVSFALPQATHATTVYVEATVPIFGAANKRRGFELLELQLSGRREEYSADTLRVTTGGNTYVGVTRPATVARVSRYASTDPTAGFRYKPLPDVMLRASYATGFISPRPAQLEEPRLSPTTTVVLDPKSGGAGIAVFTLIGGNPDITPESSKNSAGGAIFTPRFLPGLRLAVDYNKIEKRNNISTLSAQQIVDDESTYPGRVTRDSSGRITQVNTTSLNLLSAKVESFDMTLGYRKATANFGTVNVSIIGTRLLHSIQQFSFTTPALDLVGYLGFGGVKDKYNGSLTWERGRWTVGWNTAWIGGYLVTGPPITTSLASIVTQGSASVGSSTVHGVFGSYRFQAGGATRSDWRRWIANTEVQCGVKNVFNTLPEWNASYAFAGHFIGAFDSARMANYWLSMKKSF